MILSAHIDSPTNPPIELLIPWYHLGQFTNHREVGERQNNQYRFGINVVWDAFAMEEIAGHLGGDFENAYRTLFTDPAGDEPPGGYNDWIPECSVISLYVSGTDWNKGSMGLHTIPREAFLLRCMHLLMILTDGMHERASGDDSYFDYVPSEYYACLHIASHFDDIFDTNEFTDVLRAVWDGIRGTEEEEPIEFTDTYGERP